MEKGYIHLYTGDGKGKSTAAWGLAVRALCAGKNVYVGQFVKSMQYNETRIEALFGREQRSFGRIRIEQLGRGCYLGRKPDPADVEAARVGLDRCARMMASGEWNVVILDELTIALHYKLLSVESLLEALAGRDPSIETIITGRYAPQALYDVADLITEMREVKHYYRQGILSRNGIDH